MNTRLILPLVALMLGGVSLAASPAVDAEISTATSKIVSNYTRSSYREPGLDDKTCAANIKSTLDQVCNGSPSTDDIKIAAIRATETMASAWIPANGKESGLKLQQCTYNLLGRMLEVLKGADEPTPQIIGAIEPTSRIVARWVTSTNREPGLTYEQCMRNVIGSMLAILRGSPTVSGFARAAACDATGDMVTAWLGSSNRELGLTVEQCMRNLLGETLARFSRSGKADVAKVAAAKATAQNVVDWLRTRSSNAPPTTESKMIDFLTIYLG